MSFPAIPGHKAREVKLRQEDTLSGISGVGEIEMTVRLGNAEDDAVVGFAAATFIQRHEVMCRPGPLESPSVFENRIEILAALRTATMLPDVSRVLRVVVELHLDALLTDTREAEQVRRPHLLKPLDHDIVPIPGRGKDVATLCCYRRHRQGGKAWL